MTYPAYSPNSAGSTLTLDYVLVNNMVGAVRTYKVVTDKVDGREVSDHHPVYADMIIR